MTDHYSSFVDELRALVSTPLTAPYEVIEAVGKYLVREANGSWYHGIWPGPQKRNEELDELFIRVLLHPDSLGDEGVEGTPIAVSKWLEEASTGDADDMSRYADWLEVSLSRLRARIAALAKPGA